MIIIFTALDILGNLYILHLTIKSPQEYEGTNIQYSKKKPLTRIELVTSPLPRVCSTTELQRQMGRAGFEPA